MLKAFYIILLGVSLNLNLFGHDFLKNHQPEAFIYLNTNYQSIKDSLANSLLINNNSNHSFDSLNQSLYLSILNANNFDLIAQYKIKKAIHESYQYKYVNATNELNRNFYSVFNLNTFNHNFLTLSKLYFNLKIRDEAFSKLSMLNYTYPKAPINQYYFNNILSKVLSSLKDHNSAIKSAQKCYENALKISPIDTIKISSSLSNLIFIYNSANKTEYLHAFIDPLKTILTNKNTNQEEGYLMLGDYYFITQNLNLALQYYNKVLVIASKESVNNYSYAIHRLGEIYLYKKDYQKAYFYHQAAHGLLDKNVDEQVRSSIIEQEIKYQTLEKDLQLEARAREISQQKQELSNQKFIYTLIIACISLGLLLIISRYLVLQQKAKRIRAAQAMHKVLALQEGEEVERRRMSQELHDGVNSQLTAIQSYLHGIEADVQALTQHPAYQDVKRIVAQTSKEVRDIAHNLSPEFVLNQQLDGALKQFSHRLFLHKSCEIEFHQYGNLSLINTQQQLFLYRCAQEILHNIHKHAQASYIIIIIGVKNNSCTLTIEDNGIGMDETTANNGIGIKNLRKRVQQMQGHLNLESQPNKGTCIEIHLPITQNTAINYDGDKTKN